MKIKTLIILSGLLLTTSCSMFHSGHNHDHSSECGTKQCQMKDGKKSCMTKQCDKADKSCNSETPASK